MRTTSSRQRWRVCTKVNPLRPLNPAHMFIPCCPMPCNPPPFSSLHYTMLSYRGCGGMMEVAWGCGG